MAEIGEEPFDFVDEAMKPDFGTDVDSALKWWLQRWDHCGGELSADSKGFKVSCSCGASWPWLKTLGAAMEKAEGIRRK